MKKKFSVDIIEEATSGVGVTVGGILLRNGSIIASDVEVSSSQYYYYTDPITGLRVRDGIRDEDGDGTPEKVTDRELVVGGFSGIKDIGWEYIGGGV